MESRRYGQRIALGVWLSAAIVQAGDPSSLHRLVLQRDTAGTIGGEYSGATEIVVLPPFEPATVTLELNGSLVATLNSAPYRVEADLGERAIEHRFRVTASAPGYRRVSWESIINRGQATLSIRLVRREGNRIEALVTAPADDPVAAVEFFHDTQSLGRTSKLPYVVSGPAEQTSLLHAVVRTRSGLENGAALSPGADGFFGSYQWRKVPLEVSVVDERGSVLTDLAASQFKILDAGESTRIVAFSKSFNDPISIALMIDASNSMTAHMDRVSTEAGRFVEKAMRDGDRMSVYSIHQVPRRLHALSGEKGAVVAALDSLHARGNTAIWDSIRTALRELAHEPNRRAIVLLSDGQDTDSLTEWTEIVRLVRHAAIPIYAIAFGPQGELGRNGDQLRYLSAESGGFLVDATTENLDAAYQRIEEDLRARYTIQYEVFAPSEANEWREVRVRVASPRWTARAISGYFAN